MTLVILFMLQNLLLTAVAQCIAYISNANKYDLMFWHVLPPCSLPHFLTVATENLVPLSVINILGYGTALHLMEFSVEPVLSSFLETNETIKVI